MMHHFLIKLASQGLDSSQLLDHASSNHTMNLLIRFKIPTSGLGNKSSDQELLGLLWQTSTPKGLRQMSRQVSPRRGLPKSNIDCLFHALAPLLQATWGRYISQVSIRLCEEVTIDDKVRKGLGLGPNLFEQITRKATKIKENHLVSIKEVPEGH